MRSIEGLTVEDVEREGYAKIDEIVATPLTEADARWISSELWRDGMTPSTPLQQMLAEHREIDEITKVPLTREDVVTWLHEVWSEIEQSHIEGVTPTTPLQKRLSELHELGEEVLDLQDAQLVEEDEESL